MSGLAPHRPDSRRSAARAARAALLGLVWTAALGADAMAAGPTDLKALQHWSDQWIDRGFDWPDQALAEVARQMREPVPVGVDDVDWWRVVWRTQALVAARAAPRHKPQAEAALTQMLTLADAKAPLTLMEADVVRATLVENTDMVQELAYAQAAARSYQDVCAVARPLPGCDAALAWRLYNRIALRLWSQDRPGQAAVAGALGLAAAQQLGDVDKQVQSLGVQAQLLHDLHDSQAAAQRMAEMAVLAAPYPHTRVDMMRLMAQATYARHAQLPERAQVNRIWSQAAGLARRLEMPRWEVFALLNLADEWMYRRQWAGAVPVIDAALVRLQRMDDTRLLRTAHHNRGIARLHTGDRVGGMADLEATLDDLSRAEAWGDMRAHLREYADALAELGDPRAALVIWHRELALNEHAEAQTRQHALASVRRRYAADTAEDELARLTRQNQLSAAREDSLRQRQWLWLASSSLAVLVLAALAAAFKRLRDVGNQMAGSEAALRLQSERDALTGLPNRRHLTQRLGEPGQSFTGALLLLDIDHFKRVNDRHGHAAGDAALVAVAQRLQGVLREHDLVGRWGGEEFLVHTPTGAPEALAQRLAQAVSDEAVQLPNGTALALRISIGWAHFPLPGQAVELDGPAALRLVDAALYAAKDGGRDRTVGVTGARIDTLADLETLVTDWDAARADGRLQLADDAQPPSSGAPKQST